MIPRILVPRDVKPYTENGDKKSPKRVSTYMDDRTVVPSELSDAPPLTGKTNIPEHLPLGVLVDRTLVGRGMEAKPFGDFGQPRRTVIAGHNECAMESARRVFRYP